MITSGRLSAGARLPIEKDLAASLAVSRGSLREGVRALSIMGALETRQGDGTYVTSLSADRLLTPMEFVIDLQDAAGVAQVQSVRRVLESVAAALAAARIGVPALNQAEAILEGARRLISVGGDPARGYPGGRLGLSPCDRQGLGKSGARSPHRGHGKPHHPWSAVERHCRARGRAADPC